MKKLIICLALLSVLISSCKKETEDNSFVTYLPILEIKGEDFIYLNIGDNYTDEGIDSARINGVDCSSQVQIDGAVNTSVADRYVINYTLVNADGYSTAKQRTVWVANASQMVDIFTASMERTNATGTKTPYEGAEIEIYLGGSADLRFISDLMGGFYAQRAGYGPRYALNGIVKLVPDGDKFKLELISSRVEGWGYSASAFEGWFDPATATFGWTCVMEGMTFAVTNVK